MRGRSGKIIGGVQKLMKKKLLLIVATLLFALPFGGMVSARNTYQSMYWYRHPRKVIVTKRTRLYRIKVRNPLYKCRPDKSVVARKGSVLKIQRAASWYWIVTSKGKTAKHFWVTKKDVGWFTPYTKKRYKRIKAQVRHSKVRRTAKRHLARY